MTMEFRFYLLQQLSTSGLKKVSPPYWITGWYKDYKNLPFCNPFIFRKLCHESVPVNYYSGLQIAIKIVIWAL